ncbi:hypothetical protein HOF65_03665 [bacterium]|nr:hypothetical protein [bacterium]MBT3853076.1 hypothetical protein [bacterium]MBT4633566.1 hypothetical protein [bacterium]MBT6778614.1 hypothetical protein [bacterium]
MEISKLFFYYSNKSLNTSLKILYNNLCLSDNLVQFNHSSIFSNTLLYKPFFLSVDNFSKTLSLSSNFSFI